MPLKFCTFSAGENLGFKRRGAGGMMKGSLGAKTDDPAGRAA
jgi:hypothetical protein